VAGNVETEGLYRAHAEGPTPSGSEALTEAHAFLTSVWALIGPSYHWIELRDSSGTRLYLMGEPGTAGVGPSSEGPEAGRTMPVMLEINVSGESSKYGLSPEEAPDVLELSKTLANTEIAGLMTIPPFAPDPESVRPHFRRLRELRDRWRLQSGIPLEDLSMGMSGDFEVAVEEGATWVRIGSALFGTRTGGAWRLSAEDSVGEMP
jgi:hypothetical protein